MHVQTGRRVRLLFLYLAVPLLAAAGGCGVATATRGMFSGSLQFTAVVAADANENSAIAFDAVVLYDGKIADELLKLRAGEWFMRKAQFQRDYSRRVDVRGWEWVPGQSVGKQTITYRAGAKKIVLFADYGTEGDHRAAIDPRNAFHVDFRALDFDVQVDQ